MDDFRFRKASRIVFALSGVVVLIYLADAASLVVSGVWGSPAGVILFADTAFAGFCAVPLLFLALILHNPNWQANFPRIAAPSKGNWRVGTVSLVAAAFVTVLNVATNGYEWSVGRWDAIIASNFAKGFMVAAFFIGAAVFARAVGEPPSQPSG